MFSEWKQAFLLLGFTIVWSGWAVSLDKQYRRLSISTDSFSETGQFSREEFCNVILKRMRLATSYSFITKWVKEAHCLYIAFYFAPLYFLWCPCLRLYMVSLIFSFLEDKILSSTGIHGGISWLWGAWEWIWGLNYCLHRFLKIISPFKPQLCPTPL